MPISVLRFLCLNSQQYLQQELNYIYALGSLRLKGLRHPLEIWEAGIIIWEYISKGCIRKQVCI